MNRSYLFLAEGFEEIEALTTVDVMRRAGIELLTVSITDSREVTGAHGVTVMADTLFADTDFDNCLWLIIPGGMPGSQNLADFKPLNDLLLRHAGRGNIAAICAAPAVVLAPLGLLDGKNATCYPGFEEKLTGATHLSEPVVTARDKHLIITANGPAAASTFALTIVSETLGSEVARQVGSGMLIYPIAEEFYYG